jgi:16S rRNA (cytidine1402-2'-O)-methyltransferase
VKALVQFSEFFGADRQACVSRELSKIYEENIRGSLQEIIAFYTDKTVKGEIVITVAGKPFEKKGKNDADDDSDD